MKTKAQGFAVDSDNGAYSQRIMFAVCEDGRLSVTLYGVKSWNVLNIVLPDSMRRSLIKLLAEEHA